MADDTVNPTETSPLLAKPIAADVDAGDAPIGVLPNGTSSNGVADVSTKPGDDEESQNTEMVNRQGIPEVKKKLKYILPAIAIGVRQQDVSAALRLLIGHRFSSPLEIKRS